MEKLDEIEIREICGDWAMDIPKKYGDKATIFFNSRQNALNVKRILEVDISKPNHATVCNMREIIYCKDCKYWEKQQDSAQGKCWRLGIYPTGKWFCANAVREEK